MNPLLEESVVDDDNQNYSGESIPGLEQGYVKLFEKVSNDLFWVKVLNNSFFFMSGYDGENFGINCQTQDTAKNKINGIGGFESYTLLKRKKAGDNFSWRTIMATTINTTKKYGKKFDEINPPVGFIGEFKQTGNHPVGTQSIENLSKSNLADLIFTFFENHYPNIEIFASDLSGSIPDVGKGGDPGGTYYAAKGLWYLMKQHTDRFSEYVTKVPEVLVTNHNMILGTLGEEFFDASVDLTELFNSNPEKFFKKLPMFIQGKKDELHSFLQSINVFDYYQNPKYKPYILKHLEFLIDFIKPEDLLSLFNGIDLNALLKDGAGGFRKIIKIMSAKGGNYKKILLDFIDKNFSSIIELLGGKNIGLAKLVNILNYPKLDVHKDAKYNGYLGKYEITRKHTGIDGKETESKKVIGDENLIFSDKERKNLLEKHKDEIKNFFTEQGKNGDIEYIRFLTQNLPESQSKGHFNSIKDVFIDYYNKKFDEGQSEFPGKILYDSIMNQLKTKLGEKSKRENFQFQPTEDEEEYSRHDLINGKKLPFNGIWESTFKEKYPFKKSIRIPDMYVNDMSDGKFLMYLLKYFYKNLKDEVGKLERTQDGKPKFININKKEATLALSNFLYITGALNGFDSGSIANWMNKINANFIKLGQAEGNPDKYKIPSPSPQVVSWANKNRLYNKGELDESMIRDYINKIIVSNYAG